MFFQIVGAAQAIATSDTRIKSDLRRNRNVLKPDNGSDHRVRTNDIPFQRHAQAGLRVHHIVITRLRLSTFYDWSVARANDVSNASIFFLPIGLAL